MTESVDGIVLAGYALRGSQVRALPPILFRDLACSCSEWTERLDEDGLLIWGYLVHDALDLPPSTLRHGVDREWPA